MSEIMTETAEISSAEKTTNNTSTKSPRGLLWVVLAALIWGTVGVSSALLNRIEQTPPMMIAFLRLAFAAPFLLGLAWLTTKRNPFKLTRREWFYYLAMGLAMATYQVTYFFAIPMSSVTLVVVIALSSSPLIVACLSIAVFKERLTGKLIVALAAGIVGTILLAFGGNPAGFEFKPEFVWGALLALGTGFAYSILVIFSRLSTQQGISRGPIQPIAVAFSLGALVLLPITLATGSFKLEMAGGVWLIALYLGIFPTGIAYIIFFKGIAKISATAATIITLLEPAIAAVLAWLLLGESLTLYSLTGSALLLGSVFILNKK